VYHWFSIITFPFLCDEFTDNKIIYFMVLKSHSFLTVKQSSFEISKICFVSLFLIFNFNNF
jgi:hypothetical protein